MPPPAVRVVDADRSESVTLGTGTDAVVLVSTGLVRTLPDAELEAVLAHEVSHLANGDSRMLGVALAPVLAADEWLDPDPEDLGDRAWNGLLAALKTYAQFGVAVLARGRDWYDDAGAAELTSPAALASALRRLDDERGTPETDLREWEGAVAALDVLPPSERYVSTGSFRTHRPTDERIGRLERMTVSAESPDGRGDL